MMKVEETSQPMTPTSAQRLRAIDLLKTRGMLRLKDFVAEDKLTVTTASLPAEGEETRFVIMRPNGQSAI